MSPPVLPVVLSEHNALTAGIDLPIDLNSAAWVAPRDRIRAVHHCFPPEYPPRICLSL